MIRLEAVDSRNVWKLLALEVHPEQRGFVASNTESIVEAYLTLAQGGKAMPFGIFAEGQPVGFLMLGFDTVDADSPKIASGNYSLWRLMIDKAFQGKGYGRRAVELALAYVKTFPCGPARYCYLSYEPENTAAASLYHSLGFVENGEWDGEEIVAVKEIAM